MKNLLLSAFVFLFGVIQIVSQTISINSLNGGESIIGLTSQAVTWSTTGSLGPLSFYWSSDNGATWNLDQSNINPLAGQLLWSVPNFASNDCMVKLSDGAAEDESDAVFQVKYNSLSLTLNSPNGGENLTGGGMHNIMWSTGGPVASISLEYSTDGGYTWTNIASGLSPFSSSYSWFVPNISSNQCLIRMTDNIAADESASFFTINGVSPNTISIDNPNGGEVIVAGNSFDINWTPSGTTGPFDISYSIDNGANWSSVVSGVSGNTYSWTVPSIYSTNCLVKVSDGVVDDQSDAVFEIQDPWSGVNLTLNTPNGGEVLQGFDVFEITWDTISNSHIDSVEISFKEINNFAPHFVTVLNVGSYSWSVPNVNTATAKINVKLQNAPAQDSSDSDCSINPISLTIDNPNGGEVIQGGTDYQVNWIQEGNFSGVDVYLSMDGGNTYSLEASSVSDTFYVWTVPNVDTLNCLFAIEFMSFISDTSDAVFEIDFVDDGSNVDEINSLPMEIAPNPSNGFVFFIGGFNVVDEALVYDQSGKLIFSDFNVSELDLSHLTNGSYIIKCKLEDAFSIKKFIKN